MLLEIDTAQATLPSLQHFPPRFFVPQLTDKPQDPILDTLGAEKKQHIKYPPLHAPRKVAFPPSLGEANHSIRFDCGNGLKVIHNPPGTSSQLSIIRQNQLLSWDALSRWHCSSDFTPLLSERQNATFAAARYQ
jgi:hypothetical protein